MTTATVINPLEGLVLLIMEAETLTDDQKADYLSALTEGHLHPELEADLEGFLAREQAARTKVTLELAEEAEAMQAFVTEQEETYQRNTASAIAEHAQTLQTVVQNYKQNCSTIERELDQSVEGEVKSHEDTEADVIRAMLKKK